MGEAYVIIKVAADAGGHPQVVILPVYKRQGCDLQTRTADTSRKVSEFIIYLFGLLN